MCPIVTGGTTPACHDTCMVALAMPDQVSVALCPLPLTNVPLFEERVGRHTGAGVRVPPYCTCPLAPRPEPPPDAPEDAGAVTVIVLDAVADFPPPVQVTV